MKKAKHWYDYLWVYAILYFALGFFNILFAWLGMIDFLLPLLLAIFGGNKFFATTSADGVNCSASWGQISNAPAASPRPAGCPQVVPLRLLDLFPDDVRQHGVPNLSGGGGGGRVLREAIKLFWTFRVPWDRAYTAGTVTDWVAQFSFGFYSLMLTSLLIGLIVMVLYKPRTWCAFCPMGTMTQSICKLKNKD